MALAIVLVVMIVGSVVFHFWSPWWFTPLASNWGSMDTTILITFWVTGAVFVAVNLFIVYCVVRFRYSPDRTAAYEPENSKLEWWLTALTSIGVIIMLAPGLVVYNNFVNPPEEAEIVEALGQQWTWSFRYPGKDGKLGTADNRHVSFENPIGVNPDDPDGADDIVVTQGPMHLQLDKPVKILLRSRDVLHDFYVPNFRAKMDLVPGLVTYIWLTPTKAGTYELLCAELCGVGHYTMKNHVVVDDAPAYETWLAAQTTFAESMNQEVAVNLVERGEQLSQGAGCMACHSVDGSTSVGPTWLDLYGKDEMLADGSSVVVDDDHLLESIIAPNEKITKGYPPVMPPYSFTDGELDALVAYIKAQSQLGRDSMQVPR